jgi:hypothetical protein
VKWFTLLARSSSRDFRNAAIARDALENFGPHRCYLRLASAGRATVQCDTVVPDRDEKDFVTSQDLLDVRADPLLATLTTGLVAALEESFCRVQIFSDERTLARYCQKAQPRLR